MTRPKSKARCNYRVSLYNLQLMLLQIGHRSIFTNHNPQHPQMQLVQNKPKALAKMIKLFHTPHDLSQDQCCSKIVKMIDAPLPLVWSVVRRFEKPQTYKQFVKNCTLSSGDGTAVGSVREVVLVSGLPAERSTERLDRLDDDLHLMMVSIIGGDHKLINYQSTTTLHEDDEGNGDKTVLIESYVVDIPVDSCREDTCFFADTIIGYNLGSLAKVTEKMACQILP